MQSKHFTINENDWNKLNLYDKALIYFLVQKK